MILTQRGVLPPVQFAELDATLQASLLGPAGARLVGFADLDTTVFKEGVFTPTWTGFSAPPVGDLTWRKIRRVVALYNNSGGLIQGTSNATGMTITNLPVEITPDNTRLVPAMVRDNGINQWGGLSLTSGGVLAFSVMDTALLATRVSVNGAGFTAAGNKGVDTFFVCLYPL